MSETGADRFREDTLMEQALEEQDEALNAWVQANLEWLWAECGTLRPWNDAKESSDISGRPERITVIQSESEDCHGAVPDMRPPPARSEDVRPAGLRPGIQEQAS